MTTIQITTEQLTSVLDGLFGCEKTTSQMEPAVAIDGPKVFATYKDNEGQLRFAITCDLKLANSLGAALTMIPPGAAEDASATGEVPKNIGDNLYEVLNICSSVFAECEHHRIAVDQVILPGQSCTNELTEKIESAECILQIEYELQRYQSGKMSLWRVT